MIEVEPSMWVLLLAVAWGICGALGSLEELDFELPEGHELVEVFVVFAWGLVVVHIAVLLYFRSCVRQLLTAAGYSDNEPTLVDNLRVIAEEETAAWRNEAADNALDTMNRVQEELEEIEDHRNAERHVLLRKDVGLQLMATCCRKINQMGDPKLRTGRAPSGVQSGTPDIHIRFFSRKAWHVGVMFLLILNGFFIALLVQCAVYDLDDIYEEFGLAPAIMVPLPLILNTFVFQQRMFRYFVIVCSILRVDANTLGEVVNHFSEIVELRSEFATSLLDCLKEGDYTLIDLRRELHAYDPRQSGLVDVDKLRGVLSAFGFRLTRFRFNSVAMMLFELNGTKVEYGQLLRLLTLAQQEAQSENLQGSQRRQHPLLQRSQTSFEDAGQSSLRVNHSNALGESLFQVGKNVEFWRVLAHVSILAVVLLVFEYVLHYVEHHLARFDKYYHMLQKVYRELMILGLISLVLKIVKEVAPIDSSSKPMIAFQVADLIIFGFAIALVLQAMCVFLQ
ncbi:hypothetical protein JG687_00015296, partial [Phytophthora cactorum]